MTNRSLRHLAGVALASLLSILAMVGYSPAALAVPTVFQPGTIVIPMDVAHQDNGMIRAYGLVYRLLQNGVPVHWAIGNPKAPNNFGGVDFPATTVDHYTLAPVGSPYNYTGGPFIIDSTNVAAADPLIAAWRAAHSNQPVIHHATAVFNANVDITLRNAPRIALEEVNAQIAIAYFNAAGIPDTNGNIWSKSSPNVMNEGLIGCNNANAASCPATVGDGALFTTPGVCMSRKYDVFVTPHNDGYPYSLTDPTNVGTHAYSELDNFVQQGGGWVALCHSVLSNEQAIYDLYTNSNAAVKALFRSSAGGGSLSKFGFPVDPENKGDAGTWTVHTPNLPVAQGVPTTPVQKLPGGAVQTWHAPDGTAAHIEYWDATERVASFTKDGAPYDFAVNGVYHNGTGQGKMTWLGGHSYSTTMPYSTNEDGPYLRFFFNALLFNGAAVANMTLETSVASVPAGMTAPLQLLFRNTGASTATNVGAAGGVTITLQNGITYVSMATGPAPTVTPGPGGTTILGFGNLGDVQHGAIALAINITASFAAPGSVEVATVSGTYGDTFNEQFTNLSCSGLQVVPTPVAVVTKTPAAQLAFPGDEAVWTITYSNPGLAPLLNPVVHDILPPELQFHTASPAPTFVQLLPGGGQHVHWELAGPLAAGASGTITMSAIVQTRTGEPFTNLAELTGNDANLVPYSASATALVNVGEEEVLLVKTVAPTGTVLAGTVLTWSLSPNAPGPGLLDRVRLFDVLPEHTSYVGGSANLGGTFGPYVPIPAIDGVDAGSPATNLHLDVGTSPFTVASGDPVTVTMTLTNNAVSGAITVVTPTLVALSDAPTLCGAASPPTIASIAAGGGTGVFTFTCIIGGYGEIRFQGTAAGTYNALPYNFVQGTSNTILGHFSVTGSNVVTWAPGAPHSNTAGIPGLSPTTTNTLHAPALVTASAGNPATITLTQAITATVPLPLVQPGPLLAIATGAGTVLPSCSVAPPVAPAPVPGVPVNFTWTCTGVITGTAFGTLTFDAAASAPGATVNNAISNSVLLTPPLTFQAQVDPSLVATFDSVMNTGIVSDDLGIPEGVGSNHVLTPVDRPPVISVIKSVNPVSGSTVSPLATLTYTLLVSNTSAGQATNLVVNDLVPPLTTYVAASCTASIGSCSESPPGTVRFDIGTLAGFQDATLTFQVTVNIPAAAGRYTIPNVATFAGDGSGGPYEGTSNPVQNILVAPPLATILKTQAASNPPPDAQGRIVPGSTITYTLTVSNPANAVPATNVVVTDAIPEGTTFVGGSCSVACVFDAGPPPNLTFNLPNIPAGGSAQVTFQVTVDNPADPARFIVNAGCVTVDGLDGRFSPPCSQVSYPVLALPVIVVEKSAVPPSGTMVNTGNTITYTLRIRNTGNANTITAYVTDPIPANTTYVANSTTLNGLPVPDPAPGVPPFSGPLSVFSPCCADPGGDGGVLLTESSPGGAANNAIVTFQVTVTSVAGIAVTITNQATAGSSATVPVQSNITTHNTPAFTDLVIVKSDGVSAVNAGGSTTYTLTVTNVGPTEVTGAVVTDPAPISGLTLGAWTCAVTNPGSGGSVITACGAASGSGALNTTANLKVGGVVTYTIAATVTATSGSVTNFATVTPPPGVGNTGTTCLTSGGAFDPGTLTCTSTDIDAVTPVANLVIAKTDGVTTVNAGGSTTYTVTVTNNGPSEVAGAVVADPVAPGLTIGAWSCLVTNPGAGGSVTTACGNLSGTGPLNTTASFKVGGVVTYTIAATVTATSGSVTNVASVTPPPGTISLGVGCESSGGIIRTFVPPYTCSSSDTDTVIPVANLVISKTDGVTTVNAGGNTSYTVSVTNNGPSEVAGALVADPAPAGLTIGAWSCAVTNPGAGGTVTTACGAASGTGPLNTTASFKVGGVVTYTIAATVAATSGSVTNVASVTPPPGTISLGVGCESSGGIIRTFVPPYTCSSSDTDEVTPVADIAILKNGPGSVMANAGIAYTLLVSNLGPSDATNVVVTDPPVAGFTVQSVACSGESGGATCPAPANTTVALLQGSGLVIPTLPAGGSVTITVTGVAASGGQIVNVGTVTPPPGTIDPEPGNNTSTVITAIMVGVIPVLSPAMLGLLSLLLAWLGAGWVARRRQ